MIDRNPLLLAAGILALMSPLRAADIAGRWHAAFDTQIGAQKYTYDFSVHEGTITGKATYERQDAKGTVTLSDVKLSGDRISFTEPLKFDDQEIAITYEGTVQGDLMKLTRHVGDFATEDLVARRVKGSAAEPSAPATAPK